MLCPGAHIRAHRERLLLSRLWPRCLEQYWPAPLVLVHQTAVLEMTDEGCTALDAGVADVAHLLRVELIPAPLVKACNKGRDVLRAEHVDEGIAHVALVLEVNGEVEEVEGALEVLLNGLQEETHTLALARELWLTTSWLQQPQANIPTTP